MKLDKFVDYLLAYVLVVGSILLTVPLIGKLSGHCG